MRLHNQFLSKALLVPPGDARLDTTSEQGPGAFHGKQNKKAAQDPQPTTGDNQTRRFGLSSEPVARETTVTDSVPPPAYEPRFNNAPHHITAANFISISRRLGEVNDTFVLDPTLRVPHVMRALNDKVHLSLSAFMGEVIAEVYIVGSEALQDGKTRMEVTSTLGTVKLQLHAPEPRAPLYVSVSARLGEASLLLPRSFRGPLRVLLTLGEVEMSAALRAATTTFGDSRMFVGPWTEGELEQGVWAGDEAVVDSKLGGVYVGYEVEEDDDEDDEEEDTVGAQIAVEPRKLRNGKIVGDDMEVEEEGEEEEAEELDEDGEDAVDEVDEDAEDAEEEVPPW
ncbi:hypothetical protein DFH09DRAFT_1135385 [Mycena vulgaris]|nr:hypothetical protein DFH09DRAFT_1135385 [Mycena vulgaris]